MRTLRMSLFALMPALMCPLLLVVFSTAFGQVQSLSTKELTEQSTAVLLGTCSRTETYWNESRSKIFTRVRIRGSQYLKGNLGEEAEITIPGGRIGNTIYEVSDMPVFREGEEVVLFLSRHASGKTLVTGATEGKLTVEEDKKTGKKTVKGLLLPPEKTGTLRPGQAVEHVRQQKVFLDDFINEVKKYVKQ